MNKWERPLSAMLKLHLLLIRPVLQYMNQFVISCGFHRPHPAAIWMGSLSRIENLKLFACAGTWLGQATLPFTFGESQAYFLPDYPTVGHPSSRLSDFCWPIDKSRPVWKRQVLKQRSADCCSIWGYCWYCSRLPFHPRETVCDCERHSGWVR